MVQSDLAQSTPEARTARGEESRVRLESGRACSPPLHADYKLRHESFVSSVSGLGVATHTVGLPNNMMFGMPDPIVRFAVQEGRLKLGGCIISGDEDSTWWCAVCDESFVGPNARWAISQAIASDFDP